MPNDSNNNEIKRLKQELAAIESSLSWRVTAPLRKIRSFAPAAPSNTQTETSHHDPKLSNQPSSESITINSKKQSFLARYIIGAGFAMGEKNWSKATAQWEKLIGNFDEASVPTEIWPHYIKCLRMEKKYRKAEEVLQSRLTITPHDYNLLKEYGEVLAPKKWQEAAEYFRLAISGTEKEDEKTSTTARLIALFVTSKQINEARGLIKTMKPSTKDNLEIVLATANFDLANNDAQSAIKKLEKFRSSVNAKKMVNRWWMVYIEALTRAGRTKEAVDAAQSAFNEFNDVGFRVLAAEALTSAEQWHEALESWSGLWLEYRNSSWVADHIKLQIRLNISILKRIINIKDYRQQISNYQKSKAEKKVAIITSYTKGYDTLLPPNVIDESFDYIVYTDDDKANDYGIYQIRPLPKPELPGPQAIRYVKTHPHELAKNYDAVIWLDTNIMIENDMKEFVAKFLESNEAIGSSVHQLRNSIYDEYEVCLDLGKGDPEAMTKQINQYLSEGFVSNELAENGVLLFKPNDKRTQLAMEEWWQQIITFSARDQLSFPYALAKHKVKWYKHSAPPINIRNNPLFIITQHYQTHHIIEVLGKYLKELSRA